MQKRHLIKASLYFTQQNSVGEMCLELLRDAERSPLRASTFHGKPGRKIPTACLCEKGIFYLRYKAGLCLCAALHLHYST